jgi:hypothetical protein
VAREEAQNSEVTGGTSRGSTNFVLPTQVFGVVEVRRLVRELEAVDEYMRQAGLREAGAKQDTLPRVSRLLDATASDNQHNLLQSEDRKKLAAQLEQVLKQAPTVHMSFASDPSGVFLEKVVTWLRENIHPFMLVRLGLQPSIAAGCVMRTTNHAFDFSLRHHFTEQRALLLSSLELQPPSSSTMQGASEKRTESYTQYGEGASQLARPQRAESASRVISSADEQAGAAGRLV